MRSVYFIQSKFPSNPIELNALINRWEIYAEKIREKTQIRVITIVSLGSMIPLQKEFIGLRSFSKKPNFFSNLYLVVKEINSSDVKATLVAGDNQLSFIFCLIGKILSISKIRVQIQFHGDIYSYSKVGGFRGVVRVLTSRIALRFADSVRIVSQFQESEIQNITINSANTEQSITLPQGCKQYTLRVRNNSAKLQLAFNAGQSNSSFLTIPRGCNYSQNFVELTTAYSHLYIQSNKDNVTVECISWQ